MTAGVVEDVKPVSPAERLEVLFAELAELTGQRNAVDGRIVDVVAEIDRDGIWGHTGCRSVAALVAWKTGVSPRNAETLVAVARRAEQFPRCVEGLRAGSLSVDQVGVIAERAADGSDDHYVGLAHAATVTQLRTAVSLEPTPTRGPDPSPGGRSARPAPETTPRGGSPCPRWRRRASRPRWRRIGTR